MTDVDVWDSVRAREYILVNNDHEDVVSLALGGNNDKPQRHGRVQLKWKKDYSAELEIEPGPDCQGSPGNSIISQVMLWAPRTADGTGRQRLTMTIAKDSAGGFYGLIDSTTNDPTNDAGQMRSMPFLWNAGEGRGIYVGLYPVDNTIDVQSRGEGLSSGRTVIRKLIDALKKL